MNEKSAEALLSSMGQSHMVTIPNDVQPLTIKDSIGFSGKDHSDRSASPRHRRCRTVTIILVIVAVGFVLLATVYPLRNLVSISGTADSGFYISLNRDMLSSLTESVNDLQRAMASLSNALNQNKLDSPKSESKATILYLSRDPYYILNAFFQFNSVYIARSYETTLSFFIQNNRSSTYITDVSVNDTYGSQLITNGNFERGNYKWNGLSSSSSCYSYNTWLNCAESKYTTSENAVSQTFSTTPGRVLYISFKLRWSGSGAGIFTNITIYP